MGDESTKTQNGGGTGDFGPVHKVAACPNLWMIIRHIGMDSSTSFSYSAT